MDRVPKELLPILPREAVHRRRQIEVRGVSLRQLAKQLVHALGSGAAALGASQRSPAASGRASRPACPPCGGAAWRERARLSPDRARRGAHPRGVARPVSARCAKPPNPFAPKSVCRAGFATNQSAYEEGCRTVFAALDWIEDILSRQRYLVGARLSRSSATPAWIVTAKRLCKTSPPSPRCKFSR